MLNNKNFFQSGSLQILTSTLVVVAVVIVAALSFATNSIENIFEKKDNNISTIYSTKSSPRNYTYDSNTNILQIITFDDLLISIDLNTDEVTSEVSSDDMYIRNNEKNIGLTCLNQNEEVIQNYNNEYSVEFANKTVNHFIEVQSSNTTLKIFRHDNEINNLTRDSHSLQCILPFPAGSNRILLFGGKKVESLNF